MKKTILLVLVFWVVFQTTISGAQELWFSSNDVSGVVTSITPNEIRVSQKYAQNHYFLYVFKITDKTRIVGAIKKWSFVNVKYSQKNVTGGFTTTALEIQVIHPPNAYYQRMY
jgi:hypothetical protein